MKRDRVRAWNSEFASRRVVLLSRRSRVVARFDGWIDGSIDDARRERLFLASLHIAQRAMDARIGFDRASIATNALINTNKEVGRAREHLIFAPARARDATFGGGPARETLSARDALAWREFSASSSTNKVSYKGGLDLMAMNKKATQNKCVNSAEVRRFRTLAEPILLKSGEVRAEPPRVDANATYGRPSETRYAEEIRYAEGYAPRSQSIAALIRGDYSQDWVRAKVAERAAARASAATSRDEARPASSNDAKVAKVVDKEPFKLKKFGRVKSKVAAMGFF
jgi:hypothetical protein